MIAALILTVDYTPFSFIIVQDLDGILTFIRPQLLIDQNFECFFLCLGSKMTKMLDFRIRNIEYGRGLAYSVNAFLVHVGGSTFTMVVQVRPLTIGCFM